MAYAHSGILIRHFGLRVFDVAKIILGDVECLYVIGCELDSEEIKTVVIVS